MNIPGKSPVKVDQDIWTFTSDEQKRELVGTVLAVPLEEVGTRNARIIDQRRAGDVLLIQLEYTEEQQW